MDNGVLGEARRLYALGAAVLWLKPKTKRPVDEAWTTGPRKKWADLERQYRPGMNLGVRLGAPSKVEGGYLAVIDIDVKSKDERHRWEAMTAAQNVLADEGPWVLSGRGNGSAHRYCLLKNPSASKKIFTSPDLTKCFMPSEPRVSKRDRLHLTDDEIKKGLRIRPTWEVALLGTGAQVVVPPSIHPDSGRAYRWIRQIGNGTALPVLPFDSALIVQDASTGNPVTSALPVLNDFKVTPLIELDWLPISDAVRAGILTGEGVTDRSAFLLRAAGALVSAGLDHNEVLTVLTDPSTFMGEVAYEHAGATRSRRRAAEWVYRYTLAKIVKERSNPEIFTKAPPVARKLSADEMAAQAKEFGEERHWRQDIQFGQQGQPLKLVQNVVHILTHAVDPQVIKRDRFAYRDAYNCDTPWGGEKGALVSDDDVSNIKYWLGTDYGFEPPNNTISDGLIVIATKNSFDPVKDFLDGLPEWDGVNRLDTWLRRNFEAKGSTEYLAQVFRKWMVAMVMRVYEPGAKFDWMPIFEGAQGVGKSSFGRLLVGDAYFLDWLPNLNDKDSALALQGMWGVELGELSQFRRNELENIKAFITRTIDKVRPPYGKRLIESPRRCVFFGTTNRETYLIDETGNRRFKPVVVGNLDFKALTKERLQLFAEAKHLWKEKIENGRTLELTGEAKVFERAIHQEKMVQDDSDAMAESMKTFVEKVYTGDARFDLEKFGILDLFRGTGPLGGWRPEMKNLRFAGKMLKNLGAERWKTRGLHFWKMPEKPENDDFL